MRTWLCCWKIGGRKGLVTAPIARSGRITANSEPTQKKGEDSSKGRVADHPGLTHSSGLQAISYGACPEA
jgi:hypothetical protein